VRLLAPVETGSVKVEVEPLPRFALGSELLALGICCPSATEAVVATQSDHHARVMIGFRLFKNMFS